VVERLPNIVTLYRSKLEVDLKDPQEEKESEEKRKDEKPSNESDKVIALVDSTDKTDGKEQLESAVDALGNDKFGKALDKAIHKIKMAASAGFVSGTIHSLPQQKNSHWRISHHHLYSPGRSIVFLLCVRIWPPSRSLC